LTKGGLKKEHGFCASANNKEIANNGYILAPGRYVGTEEQEEDDEPFEEKMTWLTDELGELWKKHHKLEIEIRKNLEKLGYNI
jgi:type I restriction enzyme M protein